MPSLSTDILTALLEALHTHHNARRAALLVGVPPATAWRVAKKHGITLIPLAVHMRARRADPAFIAKQAPAARKGASRWLKAQHAKPEFHKKAIEAARRTLTRLNRDPAFRQASSERLKRLYDDPAFRAKQAAAARAPRKRAKQASVMRKGASLSPKVQSATPKFHKKATEAALRNLARLNRDSVSHQASSEGPKRLHKGPRFRVKQPAATRAARNRGFAIAPILYLLGLIGVGAGVLFSGYSQILRSSQTMSNTLAAKNDLQGTATTLAATSWLSNDKTLLCPPLVGSNSPQTPSTDCSTNTSAITVGTSFASATSARLPGVASGTVSSYVTSAGSPVEAGVFKAGSGVKVLDPWGHYYLYCRWENGIGGSNAIAIISAGANGKLETTCGSTTAGGDDLMVVWSTAVTQNRAAVWQTTTTGSSVTGAQFGATGTQVQIGTTGNVIVPGTLTVEGLATLGTTVATGITNTPISGAAGSFTTLAAGSGSQMTVDTSGNMNTSGALGISGLSTLGQLSAGTSTLSYATVANNVNVGGTLGVTGQSTLGAVTAGTTSVAGFSNSSTSWFGGTAQTSTAAVNIGTSVVATGSSSPLLTVGKAVSNVYPFTVDQLGGVYANNFNGSFNGNLTGNQSGGSVAATTLSASGATVLSGTLGGTSAVFSGSVTAASFIGTMTLGGGGVTISGVVPIANGGTGQTTAASALSSLFGIAGTISGMIPGADLVSNSVTATQLLPTGISAGTYSSVTVGIDGRAYSGTLLSATVGAINDGSGDTVAVGTSSGIVFTVGSSTVGDWTSGGLMVGSSKAAVNTLDVYGAQAIGTGYAGIYTAPANGLIVQGNVGIGTNNPGANALQVNGTIAATNFSGNGSGITGIGTASITGVLPIANGGTNASSQTTNGVAYYNGTSITSDTGFVYTGGSVGIGTATPNTSALLDVFSATKGLLPPRVTATQEAAIGTNAAMAGLMVYNTTTNELETYNGTTWEAVGANASDAAGSTGQVQFNLNSSNDLGADNNFFWDNTNKRLGIGTTAPGALFTVGNNNFEVNSSGTVLAGTWQGTAVGAIYGGTAQTAYSTGDILYASASNTLSRLAAGTNGYVLTLSGGVPSWAAATGSITGSGITNYVARWTGTSTLGTGVLYDNGTDVGIGTTTPATNLSVYNGNPSSTLTNFTQALTNAGLNIMTSYTAGDYTPGIFWSTGNNNATLPKAGIWTQTSSSGSYLNFGTSNAYGTGITNQAMVIDYSGNVGIGTTSPNKKLEISDAAAGQLRFSYSTDPTYYREIGRDNASTGVFFIKRAQGSAATQDFTIDISGNVGIGTATPGALFTVGNNLFEVNSSGDVTAGIWQGTAVGAIYGGTAQTAYSTGDILYASASNTLSRLAAGTNGNVLTLASGVPSWAAVSIGTGSLTGVVAVANGGTGDSTLTAHGVLVGEATSPVDVTAAGTGGQLLIGQGSSSDPSFQTMSQDCTITSGGVITCTKTNNVLFGGLATLSAAPAGTLTGTTLNSTVTASSLTSVGTITTGTWNGTTIAVANGGTGQTTAQAARGSTSQNTVQGLNIDEMTVPSAGNGLGDTNYTILSTDKTVAVGTSALTAARTWTLPAASAINAGQAVCVLDKGGGISSTDTLTLSRAGSDKVNGANTYVLNAAYQGACIISDGSSAWTAYRLSAQGVNAAGSDTQVQFNQSGVFQGSSNLVWDYTNNRLGIGTTSPGALFTVGNNSFEVNSSGTVLAGTWQGTAVGAIYGGTAQTAYSTGDILYASASNTLSRLAAGTNGYVLTLASGVPSWAAVPAPTFGGLTTGDFCTASNATTIVCSTATVNLTTQASGTLQAAQFPALTGDVTTSAGSLATSVAKIQGTTVSGTTGSGNVVFSASPTLTGTITATAANFSGNVGIGTATPQSDLHIYDNNHSNGTLDQQLTLESGENIYNGAAGSELTIAFEEFGGYYVGAFGAYETSPNNYGLGIWIGTSGAGASPSLYVENGGNVGIGTTSPDALLTVGNNNFEVNSSGTVLAGTWQGTAVGATYGGTAQTAYSTGDILYASASNTLSRLAAGTNGYVLTLASGVPSWAAASGSITGSGITNYVARWTGTSTLGTGVLYDNGTNVGVGNTNPDHVLQPMITNNTVGNYYPLNLRLDRTSTSSSNRGVGLSFSESASGTEQDTMAGIVGIRENSNSTWYGSLAFLTYGTNGENGSSESGLTEAMRIDHAGNVGIGTTAPLVKLDVNGQVRTGYQGGGTNGLLVQYNAILPGSYSNLYTTSGSDDTLNLQSWDSKPLVLNAAGNNVGIGTATPQATLDVNGYIAANYQTGFYSRYSTGALAQLASVNTGTFGIGNGLVNSNIFGPSLNGFQIGGAGAGISGSAAGSPAGISFHDNGSEVMRITSGNVGIGTTIPEAANFHADWSHLRMGLTGDIIAENTTAGGGSTVAGTDYTDNAMYASSLGNVAYLTTGAASEIHEQGGTISLDVAASGTANTAITWTHGLYVNNTGSVGIGTTSPGALFTVGNNTFEVNSSGDVTAGIWQGTAVGAIYGGTAQTAYSTGDILYASASNTLSRLAAGTNGYVLTLASGVPSWAAVPAPTFSGLTTGDFCTASSTSAIVCSTATVSLTTQVSGTLQAAQFPALTGDVTTSAGSLATTVTKIQGTTVSGTTGSGNVVFSASPTLTGTITAAAANFSGNVGIGTATPTTNLSVYNGNPSATLTNFTQALTNAGLNIMTSYTAGDYTPGIFWSTGNNNATLPKAGIWTQTSASGSYLNFGTSNAYATGITNQAMVIDYNGNVGIDTATPGQLLEISKNQNLTTLMSVLNSTSGSIAGTGVGLGNDSGALQGEIFLNSSGNATYGGANSLNILTSLAAPIAFFTSNTERMRITSTGAVGVGTTAPFEKLDIATSTLETETGASNIRFEYGPNDALYYNSITNIISNTQASQKMLFNLSNSGTKVTPLVLTATGNVGIGVTNPGNLLVVSSSSATANAVTIHKTSSTTFTNATDPLLTLNSDGAANDAVNMEFQSTGVFNTWGIKKGTNTQALTVNITGTPVEALDITNTGNVGIGQTSPGGKLDLYTDSLRGSYGARFMNTDYTGDSVPANVQAAVLAGGHYPGNETGYTAGDINTGYYGYVPSGGHGAGASAAVFDRPDSNLRMLFMGGTAVGTNIYAQELINTSNSAVYFAIDTSGNVGIGTVPLVNLDVRTAVAKTNTGNNIVSSIAGSNDASNPFVLLSGFTGASSLAARTGWLQTQDWGINNAGNIALEPFGGSVGIGTTGPNSKVQISQDMTVNPTTNAYAPLEVTGATNPAYRLALGYNTSGNYGVIQAVLNAAAYENLVLNPLGGNLGIGTTSPTQTLQVSGTGIGLGPNGGTTWPVLARESTTGGLNIQSYNGSTYTTNVTFQAGGNVGIGTTGPDSNLEVSSSGATNVSINGASANATLKFENSGTMEWQMYNDTANSNSIRITNGTNGVKLNQGDALWSSVSDARLKTDVQPFSVLDRIGKFRAVTFHWKGTEMPAATQLGVIAQEVYPLFPEVVTKGSDNPNEAVTPLSLGAWTVKYELLGPLALEGVKELKAAFDGDHQDIAKLKADNDNLKAANDNLAAERAVDTKAIEELRREVAELHREVHAQ
jgi:endosialidase-like protein